MAVRWWDFLFYMSFGVVITSSVAIAGVLLVFSFLIIPSVIGILYSSKIWVRPVIGWVSGTLVSLLGLFCSYRFDFPSGPSIVCGFGVFLTLAAVLRHIVKAERRGIALVRVGVGGLLCLLFLAIALHFRPPELDPEASQQTELQIVLQALQDLGQEKGSPQMALTVLYEKQDVFKQLLQNGGIDLDQQVVQQLGELGFPEAIPFLTLICDNVADPWMRYYGSSSLLHLGDKEGVHRLIQILKDPGPAFLKAKVKALLVEISQEDFGYDPTHVDEENERQLTAGRSGGTNTPKE